MKLIISYLAVSFIVSAFLILVMLPVYHIRKKLGKLRSKDTIKSLVIKSFLAGYIFMGVMYSGLFAMLIDELREK